MSLALNNFSVEDLRDFSFDSSRLSLLAPIYERDATDSSLSQDEDDSLRLL